MTRVRLSSVAAAIVACAALATAADEHATVPDWKPAGIVPTTATTATVFAAYRRAFGAYDAAFAARRERYRLTASGVTLEATAAMRGSDYSITTQIGDATYASGRSGDRRWRRTPAGVVRIVRSDVQGDDLDRWPASPLGLSDTDCVATGETRGVLPAWVLACRSAGDLPRWYYVDEASGDVVRETSREGTREVAIAFDDFRNVGGVRRPFRWRIGGAGGDASGEVLTVAPAAISQADVAVPESTQSGFTFDGASVQIPATFRNGSVYAIVRFGGRDMYFTFDTGTTQILMDVGAATRAGLRPVFGHALAGSFTAGGASAHDLPIETVDFFGGRGNVAGIVGNEFFLGHVVHLDYGHERLEFIRRDGFVAPPGASEMSADMREGLPLVHATAGQLAGSRFALDTGSSAILLTHRFAGDDSARLGITTLGRSRTTQYLEGPLAVREATISPFVFGPATYGAADVEFEAARPANLDIPLDGIIGTDVLRNFEWWFDYSGNRLWLRPLATAPSQ